MLKLLHFRGNTPKTLTKKSKMGTTARECYELGCTLRREVYEAGYALRKELYSMGLIREEDVS